MRWMLLPIALLTACANPEVVRVQEPRDYKLTCTELEREMEEAQKFKERAQDEKGVTGKNAAAAVLFWPALLGTYSNVEEATDAAEDRQDHLMAIYEDKGCT